jgi:putative transposase
LGNQINLIKNNLEWADKFFAASVSESKLDNVRSYINNLQTHHKKQTFLEEYKHFIQSLGYDEA